MPSKREVLVAIVCACLLPALIYTDGHRDRQLLGVIAVTSGVAGWLLYRHLDTLRTQSNSTSLLFAVLIVGVPPFGIHAELPLSSDLRLALWWLFLTG